MMNRKSARGGAILLALLAVLPAVGEAANLVKPGDVDAIDIPIENHTDSFMPLKGVRVEVTAPQHFIIKDTSIKGPLEVLPGETKMLTIDYEIAANAPEGEFVVGLKVRMDSGEASPAPASNDSEVSFTIQRPPKTTFTDSAGKFTITATNGTLPYEISTPGAGGTFSISGEGLPLQSVTLEKDGVAQNQLLSPSFTPGAVTYSGSISGAMGSGIYKLSATNSHPTPTALQWPVEIVNMALNPASTRSVYDPDSRKFEVIVHPDIAAVAGVKTMFSYKPETPNVTTSAPPLTEYTSAQFPEFALPAGSEQSWQTPAARSFVLVDNNDATSQINVQMSLGAFPATSAGPWTGSGSFESETATSTFLQGAIQPVGIHVDPITGDTVYVDPSGIGGGFETGAGPLANIQEIGTYAVELKTWNEGGTVTSCSFGSGSLRFVRNVGMQVSSTPVNGFCAFKQFYKFAATLTQAAQTSFADCISVNEDGVTCDLGRRHALSASPGVGSIYGVLFDSESFLGQQGRFFPGQTALKLGAGISLDEMTPSVQGRVSVALEEARSVPAHHDLMSGAAIHLGGDITQIGGQFKLKIAYGTSGLTDAQESRAKAFTFPDQCTRETRTVAINTAANEAVIAATGFGRFQLASSEFESEVSEGGNAFRVTSNAPAATIGDASSNPNLAQMLSVQRSLGAALLGRAYDVGPSGRIFEPPLLIEASYTEAEAAAAGTLANALLQLKSSDGTQPHPPTSVTVDTQCRKVTARVGQLSSIFGIFGGTTSVPASDLLRPITSLSVDGLAPFSAESLVMSATSTLSLSATDPSLPGAPVSGVAETLILVDAPFVDAASTPGQPYAGPFTLSPGSHTVVYYSRDNAGNVENAHAVSILVSEPPPRLGTLAIGRDTEDRLWSVVVEGESVTFAKADANDVVFAAAPLTQARADARWSVLFDDLGGAYAVGTAEGVGADLAIYKASPSGDAIVSTRIFDSGFGGDDRVFASAAPGWIVGSVQAGAEDPHAVVWRFNPTDMNVTMSTAFAAGAALGVAVDADGTAWVAGYLTNQAPRSSRTLDLGLWHFAADGQTLLSGPFRREAYAGELSSTSGAAISISSAAVTVTAPRGRTGGGTDMGAVRFDKATGAVLAESAWRAADGSSAYPAALLADGSGVVAAGGLDDGNTRAALWRFGADGALASASLAAAGGARGAAARGSELWLAVDDSTSPYKVTGVTALSGSLADVQPPRVELVPSGPSYVNGGDTFIGAATLLAFSSTDDKLALGDSLGAGPSAMYYRADSTGAFTAFASSFSVAGEGGHEISFYGVDAADNPGPVLSRSIIADLTPPITQLSQDGSEITLSASDANGSGVYRIRYLVDYLDPDVCNNVAEDTAAARGTCENPWYAGPFMLSNGGHTVRYQAFDNVGNAETAQSSFPNVESPGGGDNMGGLGIGRDPLDTLWTVNAGTDSISFAHSDSSGALISSATLQDAADGLPWSVFFNSSGRAYAIGMAEGPGTQALDLAIYKASPSGDVIESRTLFDSGHANNELVFDAKSPGWIVGAAQTSGPADFDAEGDRSLSLAIWRFDPALGSVQLSTSTTRAGFDFGSGLAVDADSSLWIVGYSARPDAPDVGGLDLALRHYAADGQTLLGGPFYKPGYLNHFDGGITAKVHVTADAVYVAAPRISGPEGFDVAFLKFDKATGQALVETVWREASGAPSYPVAILPEASGLLIAGGIGAETTDAGLWRFGYDGAFLSAATADAGGAQGAVFKGSELWLSVDGSTVPYRVSSETAVAGAVIDISTPAAFIDATPPVSSATIGSPLFVAADGTKYIAPSTPVSFSAEDPADGGAPSGVDRVEVNVDGAGFAAYTAALTFAEGRHAVSFRAIDLAGNVEAARTLEIQSDATPPATALLPSGSFFVSDGRDFAPSGFTFALTALDVAASSVASGAAFTRYRDNDGEFQLYASTFSLSEGAHLLAFQSQDNVGNLELLKSATVFVDATPPITSLQVNALSVSATSLVLISTDSLGFAAMDAGVGVLETRYALDGATPETVFSSTFSLAAGTHTLTFRSVDFTDNVEPLRSVSLSVMLFDDEPPLLALSPVDGSTLTAATPLIVASYSDPGRGVDAPSVRLIIDGRDVTDSAAVSASSASFAPGSALSQGTHTVTAFVADLAGNGAHASSAFFIDSLPPLTSLLVNGLAAAGPDLVLASTDSVSFAAEDLGVGVLETRYSVDGADEAVFTAAFFLSPGGHRLAFRSGDRAGNQEATRIVSVAVAGPASDSAPPLVSLDFPGAAGLGVERALGGVVDVRGVLSDASAVTWTLEAAPGESAGGGFAAIASGAGSLSGFIAAWNTASLSGFHTLRLRAIDAFGNEAQAATTVFVGSPVFDFSIGRKDSDVIVNAIKGPTGIAVRSDGAIWVASTQNDKILLLSPAGVLLGETGEPSFKTPQGLALDAADNLYAADRDLHRVVKLAPDGQALLLQFGKTDGRGRPKPGSGPGELRHPFDVAVDGNGDVYVADSGNRRIQVFDSSGAFLRQFGQGVLLSTSEVRGIALTAAGLWVSDRESERIFLFSRAGVLIKSIGGGDSVVGELSRLRGLASDRLGALYVVEPNRDRAQKFDPQGKGLLAFGGKEGLSRADKHARRYLTMPVDAAMAPDGTIWFTDTGRDRIVRYATTARAPAGGLSSAGSVEPARRVVDHKDGAKVERDDGAGVRVPKGALAADIEITVDKGDENQDKDEKIAKRRQIKIMAVSEEIQYGPEGTTFSVPVTLTIPYDANLAASQGIKEDDLKVYYWNPTLKDWEAMPSTVDKIAKTVNAQTTHFSAYQAGGLGGIGVAAIDDFGLRDGYAFPNPSRNGSAVTFRLQPGSADSIEVRVYDLSGRKVHSSSDFRFRGAFDDENGKGAQNTYDHVWDASGIGSGVYTFVMTARKSGQSDVRKTGKVGVIR